MKVLFLGYLENRIIDFLRSVGDKVINIAPEEKIKLGDVREINPDFILSYGYKHIIKPEIIRAYPSIVNLHIAFLPWNKGYYPNFGSFLENTPKGYSIHYIDKGIDTGDILFQERIRFQENETLNTSYDKLREGIEHLLISIWQDLANGRVKAKKQNPDEGCHHFARDLERFKFLLEEKGWDTPVKEIEGYGRTHNLWRFKGKRE